MAEADPAVVADDGAQVADTPIETDNTPEPIANLARELGWTPKEDWQGEPDKWKPAEQFIRDGRDIQQTTSRELKAMREQVERLSSTSTQILQDQLAKKDAEWQARIAQATEEGDTATVLKLTEQRPSTSPQPGPDPQVAAWVARNPWYNTDPLAQARAQELSDRLKHLPVAEQLVQVERMARKEFPEHFPAPVKPAPATQTGAARNAGASNRQKGFADMPQDSQRIALDYEKRLGVKKEDFAQKYWAEQEGVKR